MLIVDGPRVPLDAAPGETVRVELAVELPAEDGRYLVFVSPMREDVCWYYERGWRFAADRGGGGERPRPHRAHARGHPADRWRARISCAPSAAPSCIRC